MSAKTPTGGLYLIDQAPATPQRKEQDHMSTLSREFLSRMRGRAARFTEEPERGSITLEQVIWTAIIAGGAVLVAGVVLAAIMAYSGQIPTG